MSIWTWKLSYQTWKVRVIKSTLKPIEWSVESISDKYETYFVCYVSLQEPKMLLKARICLSSNTYFFRRGNVHILTISWNLVRVLMTQSSNMFYFVRIMQVKDALLLHRWTWRYSYIWNRFRPFHERWNWSTWFLFISSHIAFDAQLCGFQSRSPSSRVFLLWLRFTDWWPRSFHHPWLLRHSWPEASVHKLFIPEKYRQVQRLEHICLCNSWMYVRKHDI